ncbi:hypothetical protein [Alloactinosynnema sp. L-07]|nr:hypothetical protein [Alloactinosynnema sp. L-07]
MTFVPDAAVLDEQAEVTPTTATTHAMAANSLVSGRDTTVVLLGDEDGRTVLRF